MKKIVGFVLLVLLPCVAFAQEAKKTAEDFLAAGNTQLIQNMVDEAEEAYLQAIALKPAMAQAHFKLGHVYMIQKKYDQSLKELETGMKYDRTLSAKALSLMIFIATYKDDARAAGYFRRLSAIDQPAASRVKSLVFFARIFGLQHINNAFVTVKDDSDIEEGIKKDVKEAETFYAQGKRLQAIQAYKKIIEQEISPRSKAAVNALIGDIYVNGLQKPREGIPYFEKAIQADPSSARARIYLTETYRKTNDTKNALKSAQELLGVDSKSKYAIFAIAEIYYKMGKWAEAVQWSEKVRQSDPILFALIQDQYESAQSRLGK